MIYLPLNMILRYLISAMISYYIPIYLYKLSKKNDDLVVKNSVESVELNKF